jgi:predicted ArsR family transcriptional regulator
MTPARFDEPIHASTRLPIVALLAAADWVQFAFIRDQLGLSDSALSKHLSTLENAGYIDIWRSTSEPGRPSYASAARPPGRRSGSCSRWSAVQQATSVRRARAPRRTAQFGASTPAS